MVSIPLNHAFSLSIIIPCFNEEKTLGRCIDRVMKLADKGLSLEVIIVDDGSRDNSLLTANNLATKFSEITVLSHKKNMGKGAALRTGFGIATGDFIAVQDADLETNPEELKGLIVPLMDDEGDVVYGSRFLHTGRAGFLSPGHYWGNRFLTSLSNLLTGLRLTDMMTCYKVFKREVIEQLDIREEGFGIEPEITARIARKDLRIKEMGISYNARSYSEGKKIRIKDAIRAAYCILYYNMFSRP